jgi:regulator of nucleoside diphosphate kinase
MAMNSKNIVITESDFELLRRLIAGSRNGRDGHHLEALDQELKTATVVDSSEVPCDVVTMNSRVRVRDLDTGREFVCQIVFPGAANAAKNRISVLAPIGTALLGCPAGSTIEWQVPSGLRRLSILDVEFQPEAAGMAA